MIGKLMIETNNKGLVRMTRALLPHFVQRKNGVIMNIGSIAGSTGLPRRQCLWRGQSVCRSVHFGACRLIGTGVRACNIAPGLCGGTEFSNVRLKGRRCESSSRLSRNQPLTAVDIAETAYWIATLPPHININYIEMMPMCQGFWTFGGATVWPSQKVESQ